jgi:type IV pilus assembly protein PilV
MNTLFSNKRKATGFTLIEVLVTMLILAVGLLGIAALQLKGLQFNHDSALRSQISNLAYDVADRMRIADSVNPTLLSGYLDANNGGSAYVAGNAGACDQTLYPTNGNIANDLNCWHQAVDNALPPGSTASIAQIGTQYTVTLAWRDRDDQPHNIFYTFSIL